MRVTASPFGISASGEAVDCYYLENSNGMIVECIGYGAAIRAILLPDGKGGLVDVALGYDTLAGYEADTCCIGATIGRYANRIRGGSFTLHGRTYRLEQNSGPHHLHGGSGGFHKRLWAGTPLENGVCFLRYSPDGEAGYPGGLFARVSYHLLEDNTLCIRYSATAEADTLCNFTNHCYFNLAGHDSGSALFQTLQLHAGYYLPADAGGIPTGEIHSVVGAPFDFREAKPLGRDISAAHPQLMQFGGYDHTFAIDRPDVGTALRPVARAEDPASGRAMEVRSDRPGVQLYTANTTAATGKGGAAYAPHCAFCLETQCFPDSPHQGHFAGALLRAGETFSSTTEYQFYW